MPEKNPQSNAKKKEIEKQSKKQRVCAGKPVPPVLFMNQEWRQKCQV
jgi:hypothetical protein